MNRLPTRMTPVALRGYRRAWLASDIVAGLTLAAVAIPEVMGHRSAGQCSVLEGG